MAAPDLGSRSAVCRPRGSGCLNNRYHDPTLGSFISVDPLVVKTGQPYMYGNANPTTYSDPLGLEPRPIHCRSLGGTNCGDPGPDPYHSGCGGYGCGGSSGQTAPTSGIEIGEQEHLYDKEFFLFPDDHGGAAFWMGRMQNDPTPYFPFRLRVDSCATGGPVGTCKPIQVGNVLHLSGGFPDLLGRVEVIDATATSFRFIALQDHEAGRFGTITFSMRDEQYGDGADVYLNIVATTQVGGPWNVEGSSPSVVTEFGTQLAWSAMTAAFRCEHAYVGQEQFRRC